MELNLRIHCHSLLRFDLTPQLNSNFVMHQLKKIFNYYVVDVLHFVNYNTKIRIYARTTYVFDGFALFVLNSDWNVGGFVYKSKWEIEKCMPL